MLGLIPTQFMKPSGHIHHVENYLVSGIVTGNRLLPSYGIPNNDGIDYYNPVAGGSFPGMSTQNGMTLYFSFNWSGS